MASTNESQPTSPEKYTKEPILENAIPPLGKVASDAETTNITTKTITQQVEQSVVVCSPRINRADATLKWSTFVRSSTTTEVTSVSSQPQQQSKRRKRGETKIDLRKIKVVSFDLDDTLWSCAEVIEKAEKAMHRYLETLGHHHMIEELKHPRLGAHQKAIMAKHPSRSYDVTFIRRSVIKTAAELCNISDQDIIEKTFEHFYHARTFHVSEHLFPGAVEAVARMKKLGLRIGTITNGNADVFKVPELAQLVEHHVNPEMAGAAKPSVVPFELLRKRFGDVRPNEILHVGDSYESDVVGAMNAGMSICWVTKEMDGERGDDNIIRVAHVSDLADMFEEAFAEQI